VISHEAQVSASIHALPHFVSYHQDDGMMQDVKDHESLPAMLEL
jgi:hypothetical protein